MYKKPKKSMSLTLLAIAVVVIVYVVMQRNGVFNKDNAENNKSTTSQTINEYDYIIGYDYVGNYPDGPAKVVELNNRITAYLYGDQITDEQIPEVIKRQRNLFSIDLLGLNSADLQIEAAKQQIAKFQESRLKIIRISTESPVYDLFNVNMCTVTVTQYLSNTDNQFVKYNLINEDGVYKIYSWESISSTQVNEDE